MTTHYCFVFSCLISIFIFFAFFRQRKCGLFCRVSSLLFIVIPAYLFTYEFPIASVNETVLACSLPFIYCWWLLFFHSTHKFRTPKNIIFKYSAFIAIFLSQILSLWIIYGFPWIKKTFMIDNAEAVIFTLKASKNGAWDAVLTSFSQEVFKPSLIALILGILSTATAVLLSKRNFFYATRTFSQRLFWVNLFLGCGWLYFAVVSVPVLGDSALNIYKTYTKKKILVHSALYEKYYASANTARIHFEAPPRNLIFIMLESMGVEHISALSELKKIQQDNLSFLPGGESVATQGWTIGSQIAKYCGVPLKFPAYDSIHVFLPNATCIQDLLDSFGYHQLYIQGTDKSFLSFGYFLETHSNIEMHDFSYYLQNKRINQRTSPWGIDDYTLFELLKQDLEKLSSEKRPFALYAMTMDTHWPMGHISEKCDIGESDLNDQIGTYKRALLCSSKYVKEFLNWAQKQTWYENTLIAIQGDHMIPANIRNLLAMPKTDSNFWYNVFINAPIVDNVERKFSGFDMFPTILEMMGAYIEGHKLNLGTSLLSNEPTLLEKLGNRQLDSLLNLSDEMDLFFMGVNK